MKWLAFIASAIVLIGYLVLARVDPAWGLLRPRGGILTLALSLAVAHVAISASVQPHRSLSDRFQFLVAGWIWIIVQGGCMVYLLFARA